MEKIALLEKKRNTITDFIAEVSEHEAAFSEPCPSKILAAKFAKRVRPFGGYRNWLRELEMDGTIQVMRLRTGGILVSLSDALKAAQRLKH